MNTEMIEIKIIAQCIEKYLHKTETSFGPFFYYPLISSVLSKTLDLLQICFTVVEGIFQLQGNVSALSSVFILFYFIFILFFYQTIETNLKPISINSISGLVA